MFAWRPVPPRRSEAMPDAPVVDPNSKRPGLGRRGLRVLGRPRGASSWILSARLCRNPCGATCGGMAVSAEAGAGVAVAGDVAAGADVRARRDERRLRPSVDLREGRTQERP